MNWHCIVLYKDAIPRCSFILWLVCREKLKRWGVIDDSTCVLCGVEEENRDHLFFGCVPFLIPYGVECCREINKCIDVLVGNRK